MTFERLGYRVELLDVCGGKRDGISYDVSPQDAFFWGKPAKSMSCKLKSVLEKGMTFGYEYDFGSTTELTITVVNYRSRTDRKENNPIETLCDACGEEMLLPVCNSPRMGVCGYCGSGAWESGISS